MSDIRIFQQKEKEHVTIYGVSSFEGRELSGDELAVVRGSQFANAIYTPDSAGGPLGVGPGIGPGYMSGGLNIAMLGMRLCETCGTAPAIFSVGGPNVGPFTSAENNNNVSAAGGNTFRNLFFTIMN